MRIAPARRVLLPALLLATLAPATAFAHEPSAGGINAEIRAEMAQARREVRAELALARAELETGNLALDRSLHLGGGKPADDGADALPKAEITPAGELLISGRAIPLDAGQRRDLLAYRGQVIDLALAGIELGERSANAAIDAVDQGLFRLMLGAMTGSLERRVEKTIREAIEPGVRQICLGLPALFETQQRLAGSIPDFQPYATLKADEVDDCMDEVSRAFAQR